MYGFLKKVFTVSIRVFFKKVSVKGRNNIPKDGPIIIVSNHPNTLMDPIIIATLIKRRIGFIANASLFKNKIIARFFRYLHMIPIYRKIDVKPGEIVDNTQAFVTCHDYLAKNRVFLIFPEGSSYYELKLRPIKTGTARIALSYEADRKFKGDLKILPITLDYSDAIKFRSVVSIDIQEPIFVSKYVNSYQEDSEKSFKILTEEIRLKLSKNIPLTTDKNEERLLINAHQFYTSFCNIPTRRSGGAVKSLEFRKGISSIIRSLSKRNSQLHNELKLDITNFFDIISKEKLNLEFYRKSFQKLSVPNLLMNHALILIILAPLYVFGLLFNFIPYQIPYRLFLILKLDIEYKAAFQMIVGCLVFPICYYLSINQVFSLIDLNRMVQIFFLISVPLSGFTTLYYYKILMRFLNLYRYHFHVSTLTKQKMNVLRSKIIHNIYTVELRARNEKTMN